MEDIEAILTRIQSPIARQLVTEILQDADRDDAAVVRWLAGWSMQVRRMPIARRGMRTRIMHAIVDDPEVWAEDRRAPAVDKHHYVRLIRERLAERFPEAQIEIDLRPQHPAAAKGSKWHQARDKDSLFVLGAAPLERRYAHLI